MSKPQHLARHHITVGIITQVFRDAGSNQSALYSSNAPHCNCYRLKAIVKASFPSKPITTTIWKNLNFTIHKS